MNYYSGKELVEILNQEKGTEITLRKIRYYSQIDMLSPLELVNGKQKYSDKHLEELRAIQTMQKTGEKLDDIKGKISKLDIRSLSDISQQNSYFSSERLMETIIEYVDEDVSITFNKQMAEEKKKEIIEAVEKISKKYRENK